MTALDDALARQDAALSRLSEMENELVNRMAGSDDQTVRDAAAMMLSESSDKGREMLSAYLDVCRLINDRQLYH